MAKKEEISEEVTEKTKKPIKVGSVKWPSGVSWGINMPDGTLVDLSDKSEDEVVLLGWIVKTLDEIKRNIA